MKKEITPGFMWHLDEVVLTFQVAIVTTADNDGHVNAAPFGLVLPFNSGAENPQMLLCSNSRWHTSINIEATGEFVINYAHHTLMEKTAQTGLMYSEGINELNEAGLTAIPSIKLTPPRIKECYQHIECRLNQVLRPSEYQNNFIGDIVAVSLNEDLPGRSREEKIKRADPLLLFGIDITKFKGNYARVGETRSYGPSETDVK